MLCDLAHSSRAQADEATNAREIADLGELPQIALHIGLEVGRERLPRIEALIEDPGIEAAVQQLVHRFVRFRTASFGK